MQYTRHTSTYTAHQQYILISTLKYHNFLSSPSIHAVCAVLTRYQTPTHVTKTHIISPPACPLPLWRKRRGHSQRAQPAKLGGLSFVASYALSCASLSHDLQPNLTPQHRDRFPFLFASATPSIPSSPSLIPLSPTNHHIRHNVRQRRGPH